MPRLIPALLALHRDPRLLKLPPYFSLTCILVGLAWLLVLPLDEYSRHTYISENALLPGQVHTYFGGSEHTVFRAYRHEVAALSEAPSPDVAEKLATIFKSQGLKVGRQKYSYQSASGITSGENVYAVLQGPRADATEAMVLSAGWRTMDGVLNQSAVALVLTMARYFKRWSLWSKDIIFVITEDSVAGMQAWVDAYHDQHDSSQIESLPIKAGALQGAIALEYPAGTGGFRYDKLHILYDGVNGQLPNLDLFNTVVHVARDQVGITCSIQNMQDHHDQYPERLETIFRGILTQSLGHATGPHSSFMPYHVDAITLQTVGAGWHDEMSLGKTVESSFRSINNLLEHLHQSFFFYLLMDARRFVSIGTYLPSAMLVAVNFSITAIALWLQSGRPTPVTTAAKPRPSNTALDTKEKMEVIKEGDMIAVVPKSLLIPAERRLLTPLVFVLSAHFLGLIPLYAFNGASKAAMIPTFATTALVSLLLPYPIAYVLRSRGVQEYTLITCFSLLVLGICLATLSTLNFSLGLAVGLLASPLSFIRPLGSDTLDVAASRKNLQAALTALQLMVLILTCPATIILIAGGLFKGSYLPTAAMQGVEELLVQASFAWHVSGTWTIVVVWFVWWPAWLAGAVVGASRLFGKP